jgi:hypothetical protein
MNAEDGNGPVIETHIDEFVVLLERVARGEPVTEEEMRAVRWCAGANSRSKLKLLFTA